MTQGDTETTDRRSHSGAGDMGIRMVVCTPKEGDGLIRVMLAPWGLVRSLMGDFTVDEESARLISEAFAKEGRDLPIDFEHATMGGRYGTPSGAAPAAGWITTVSATPGVGIFGLVKWNNQARDMIRNDEYRWLSPVLVVRKSDAKAVALHSAALTNKPAIQDSMQKLAAKDVNMELAAGQRPLTQEKAMNELLLIGKDLGLAEADCKVETIVNKIGELKERAKPAPETAKAVLVANAARKALGLKDDADASAVEVAINSHKQAKDAAGTQATELATLKEKFAEREADDLMRPYITANKINPNATEDVRVCRNLAKSDPETFKKLMAERPALVEPGRTTPPAGGAKTGSSKEEELIANAVKEHKGDYGAAMAELQLELKQPYLLQGLTNRAANARCAEQFPTIFAV